MSRVFLHSRALSGFPALLAIGLAACAARSTAPAAPAPQTTAVAPASPLQPPEAAVRASERLQPTGLEMGTMWTFENPPLDYWARTYNFRPTQQWLDHVRLSALKYDEECTASFVSSDGLIMTNHHCGRSCTEALSSPQNDLVAKGFYAPTRAEEKVCPDLFVDQLVSIQDVTQQVRAAAPASASDSAATAATEAASQRIESECAAQTKLRCEVVSLYHGGQYHLYRYQRYQPVKLVFAPELQTGYFGGDPDNFTYPRYDLDITFVRAYQADGRTPVHPADYFRWRAEGPNPGEPVFVPGNPGTTSRLITLSQFMYARAFRLPFTIAYLQSQYEMLQQQAQRGPEEAQRVRNDMFDISNSLKAYRGEYGGVLDTLIVARKIAWERDFRNKVQANAQLRAEYGDVWDRMAAIQAQKLAVAPPRNAANIMLFPDPIQIAGVILQIAQQSALPDAQRQPQFRGQNLAQLRAQIGQIPMDTADAIAVTTRRLQLLAPVVPANDPILSQMMTPGESPQAAARRLVGSSRILDPAFRQQLLSGGTAAVNASTDPIVRLARNMVAASATLDPRWARVNAEESAQQARLARALFAVYGTSVAPDATFTLRISDGVVQGYPYNGTEAPPFTTIGGLYARSAEFQNKDPFTLAPSWANRRAAVNMDTYFNLVATNDITGGNSGSPLIDEQGRIVGLIFDGNIESLPITYMFPVENERAVAVHAAGITEALRSVYQATALLRELTGAEAGAAATTTRQGGTR